MKFIKLLSLILFLTLSLDQSLAAPTCKSSSSDSDGDGWGWENKTSCKVIDSKTKKTNSKKTTAPSSSSHPNCKSADSDPDGDGWGWENKTSCKVVSIKTKKTTARKQKTTKKSTSGHPDCKSSSSDPDGDGWGWENEASCKVTGEKLTTKNSTPKTAAAKVKSETSPPLPVSSPKTSAKRTSGKTPFQSYGKLKICGSSLCSEKGEVVQLKGMSSHGIHRFPWGSCVNDKTLDMLANDWKNDIFRIAMYVSGGKPQYKQYAFKDKEQLNIEQVNKYIEEVSSRGMYAMVDFHILSENPKKYTKHAKRFFKAIASKNKDRENIIYEIANEPTGTSWEEIKTYANEVIPVIREYDKDAIIVVGTRQWSSFNHGNYLEVVNNPVKASNIMYAFHAYAPDKSHQQKYLGFPEKVKSSTILVL